MYYFIFAYALLVSSSHFGLAAVFKPVITAHETNSRMYSEIKIAFGSLFSFSGFQEPDIFQKIVDSNPDVFLWLGDAVASEDFEDMEGDLIELKKKSGYLKLTNTAYITGVTDLGPSNYQAKNRFFYFLGEEFSSPRRTTMKLNKAFWIKTNPSYESSEPMLVKVMLLDVNKIDDDQDEISEEQFDWIAEELKEKVQDHFLTVIASPYQILQNDIFFDSALAVHTKLRLLRLIQDSTAPVVLLSGSALYSFGEVLKYPCSDEELGYPLYEMTSAGLNIKGYPVFKEANRLLTPPTFSNFTDRVFRPNYGELRIRYNHVKPSTSDMFLEIHGRTLKRLISKNPYVPQKPEKMFRRKGDLACASEVYSDEMIYSTTAEHFFETLFSPDFISTTLLMIAGAGSLLTLLTFTCIAGRARKGGFEQLDEYEKYHME